METKCPVCGQSIVFPSQVCDNCGSKIKAFKNLVTCRVCGAPVANPANKCPHCGVHTTNKKNFVAALVALVIIGVWIIVMILMAGLSDGGERKSDVTSTTPNTALPLTDEEKAAAILYEASDAFYKEDYMDGIQLCKQIKSEFPETETAKSIDQFLKERFENLPHFNAPDLMAEYDANIVNADEKYTDTVMVVSGIVTAIGKVNNDRTLAVMLDSGTYLRGVQLNFEKTQTETVAKLREGDKVSAIGLCTGISGTHLIVFSGDNIMINNCYIID